MEASGTVARDQEIEFNALCGSLSMMSKGKNADKSDIISPTHIGLKLPSNSS